MKKVAVVLLLAVAAIGTEQPARALSYYCFPSCLVQRVSMCQSRYAGCDETISCAAYYACLDLAEQACCIQAY